jgi:hypothetical protein
MKTRVNYSGTTLIELLVTLGVVSVAGSTYFWAFWTIITLGAKNDAVNIAHEEGRKMMNQSIQQIHNSVSLPQLLDASLAAVSGTGPTAGVGFQTVVAGPGILANSDATGQPQVTVQMNSGDPSPAVGMRLIIPGFEVEQNIIAVSGTSPNFTVTLASNLTSAITCSSGTPNYQVYYTQRSALVVLGGVLYYYPSIANTTKYAIARNVTSAAPFSVPGSNNQVQISLTTVEPNATGRGYPNVNLQSTVTVPIKFQLTSSNLLP